MNRILLCFAFIGCTLVASSQKIYFIYVQAESGQPFYVKLSEKVFSSTASGYLILPKLKDSTYSFSVGFTGNQWPEQRFTVSMERKDHGFLLKNFGDKGWGLFDLQTLTVQMASQGEVKKDGAQRAENKDASDFTNVLSKAADDPSLKEKPVKPKPEEPVAVVVTPPKEKTPELVKTEPVITAADPSTKEKPAPVKPEETKTVAVSKPEEKAPETVKTEPVAKVADDPAPREKTDPPKTEEVKTVAVAEPPLKNPDPVVKTETEKKEEPKNTNPTVQVKEEIKQDPPKDPVVVKTVPTEAPKEPEIKVKEEPAVVTQPAETEKVVEYKPSVVTRRSESSTSEGFGLTFTDAHSDGAADTIRIFIPNPKPVVIPAVVIDKQEPKEEPKFLETDSVVADTTLVKPGEVKQEDKPVVTAKNNCPATADDDDFLRIRKRMTVASSDEKMIAEASRVFKTKCFTSSQVRELGKLFYDDKGRYRFFDEAYPYVSDAANFPSLETELKDAYYVNRFKAMIR